MTKPMDKRQVLLDAAHEMLAEILNYYHLTPEVRQAMEGAKVEVNDFENLSPALPVVTWEVARKRHSWIALELMGRKRAPIERVGRWAMQQACRYARETLNPPE